MSYRILRTALAAAIIVILLVPAAQAQLRGNTYTSQQHHVSFTRPDRSWEFRAEPAHDNGVALFSNGQGTVIALLMHKAIPPRQVIDSPGQLEKRWPALATQFAGMANAGESGYVIETSHYEVRDNTIQFDIRYGSSMPHTGDRLANWVHGMIVRGNDDRQHIYAIRCAAPAGVFNAWESQFDLIVPTLTYNAPVGSPVYVSAPIPTWWYAAGVVILLGGLLLLKRNSNSRRGTVTHQRPLSAPSTPAAPFIPGMPIGSQLPPEVAPSYDPNAPDQIAAADLSNVPDQYYYQGAHEQAQQEADGHEHAPIPNPDATSVVEFWKCSCGRMNPATESYCARCNADRPEN